MTPEKPWEGVNLRNFGYSDSMDLYPNAPNKRLPPPLPPRAYRGNNMRPMVGGPSLYHPLMYGNGAGYMGSGSGYMGYGRPGEFLNRYVQLAEESSQPAFQSIDSFVRAFSSITMMMESTFQAMTMSFRAVLSVADNMSRLKSILAEIFSSMMIFKTLHWFYRKVLYTLGLVNSSVREDAWKFAESQTLNLQTPVVKSSSALPLMGFFGLILGGPYLIYKFMSPEIVEETQDWDPNSGQKVVALYDFNTKFSGELSFRQGEFLTVMKSRKGGGGWVMAAKGDSVGLIPADRVALIKKKEHKPKSQGQHLHEEQLSTVAASPSEDTK